MSIGELEEPIPVDAELAASESVAELPAESTDVIQAGGVVAVQAAAELDPAVGIDDKSWQDLANCLGVDPDIFFPERGASTREAKTVCQGCAVKDDCLEYALANGQTFGIWGGMTERERRRIRRSRLLGRA